MKSVTLFVVLLAIGSDSAFGQATLAAVGSPAVAQPGQTVTISFEARDVTDLYGVSFNLLYDPAGFSYDTDSAVSAAFFDESDTPIVFDHDDSGTLSLAFTRTDQGSGVSGTGVIGSVTFTVLPNTSGTGVCVVSGDGFLGIGAGGTTLTLARVDAITEIAGVWPGDTDNDCTVDTGDILPIGARFDVTGPTRATGSDYSWATKALTAAWTLDTDSYVDATGDGVIDQRDVLPIGLNFAETRASSTGCTPAAKGLERLVTLPAVDAGDVVRVGFLLDNPDEEILGAAFKVVANAGFEVRDIGVGSMLSASEVLQLQDFDGNRGEAGFSVFGLGAAVQGQGQLAYVELEAMVAQPQATSLRVHDLTISGVQSGIVSATPLVSFSVNRGSDEPMVDVPMAFGLAQNYPNPFNPVTTIRYQLAEAENVRLTVYDVLGRTVMQLVPSVFKMAGAHEVSFDASDFESGLYVYRLDAGANSETRSMLVLK